METRVPEASNPTNQNPERLEETDSETRNVNAGPSTGSRKRFRDRRADDLNACQTTVLDLVEECPGLTVKELATKADVPTSTCDYAVKRLEHLELVQRVANGRNRHFFPAATQVGLREKMAPYLKDSVKVDLLQGIRSMEDQWLSPHALAQEVGVDSGLVYRMMLDLHDKGVVSLRKINNRWRVKLLVDLEPLLDGTM